MSRLPVETFGNRWGMAAYFRLQAFRYLRAAIFALVGRVAVLAVLAERRGHFWRVDSNGPVQKLRNLAVRSLSGPQHVVRRATSVAAHVTPMDLNLELPSADVFFIRVITIAVLG